MTLLGITLFKLSLSDKEYKDSAPFKSIVSNANKSKSSLWIDSLDIRFPLDKIVIINYESYLIIITENFYILLNKNVPLCTKLELIIANKYLFNYDFVKPTILQGGLYDDYNFEEFCWYSGDIEENNSGSKYSISSPHCNTVHFGYLLSYGSG